LTGAPAVRRLREASDTGSTRSHLLAVLDATPEELGELFADVVAEPDDSLISIVQWSLFSTGTLKTKELYSAVQASVGEIGSGWWDVDEIDDDGMVLYLVHASRGLMETSYLTMSTYDTETGARGSLGEQIFIFVHESVREYFLCGGLASMNKLSLHETNAVGHAKLAAACLSYLEFAVDKPGFPVPRNFGSWTDATPRGKEEIPFMWYASENYLRHAEIAFASDLFDLAILEGLPLRYTMMFYRRSHRRSHRRSDFHRLEHDNPPSMLYLLIQKRCFELAKALLRRPSKRLHFPTAQHDIISTPCKLMHRVTPDLRFAYDELSLAVYRGRMDFVPLLFHHGFDVNMKAGQWGRPIRFAVSRNDLKVVQILSSYGARVDTVETKNILHLATEHASQEMVQFLLEKGVPVNNTDDRSQTALHLVVGKWSYLNLNYDDVTIAGILLEAGADIDAADCDGKTVLIRAAARRRTRLVHFLLGKGANVHARDHRHLTALYVATGMDMSRQICGPTRDTSKMYRVLQALLDAGADINAKCGPQKTMLITACLGKHYRLVSFLVDRGAISIPGDGPWEELVPLVLEEACRHAYDSQPESPASETWSIDAHYSSDAE
jgi:ankyrin repeat protein